MEKEKFIKSIEEMYSNVTDTGSIVHLENIVDDILATNPNIFNEVSYEDIINEVNIVRFDKNTQLQISNLRSALLAAKASGDIKYKKMIIFRRKYIALRNELREKYRSQGIALARKAALNRKQHKN